MEKNSIIKVLFSTWHNTEGKLWSVKVHKNLFFYYLGSITNWTSTTKLFCSLTDMIYLTASKADYALPP